MVRHRDTVLIGGSAGAIEALVTIVRGLPADLPAAVFVVIHVPAGSASKLPLILSNAGLLEAGHAREREPIRPGRIYVAPPDRHLLIRDGFVELSRGPRENHSRPAIDPLFRSAARARGDRAIGIVLSGALSDGTSGLLAVAARGGAAIVQDPDEAVVASMPASARSLVPDARVLPAGAIAAEIVRLVREPLVNAEEATRVADNDERLASVIRHDFAEQATDGRTDAVSVLTCPDCGGVMWQADNGPAGWFRCHVGHAYAPEVLLIQKSDEVEAALWACVRLLHEKATLSRQSAARTRTGGHAELAARIDEQAQRDERHARMVRALLEAGPGPVEQSGAVLADVTPTSGGASGDRA